MDRTIALIRKSHDGDKEARMRLVEENTGLVRCVSRRFYGRGQDPEDLFQIGSIGLLKAIDKFDTSYGVRFSTYAVPLISGEIRRFLRDDGMVKVSRALKERGLKIRQAADQIQEETGREATLAGIAAKTDLSPEEIAEALEANAEIESISQEIRGRDGEAFPLEEKLGACDEEEKDGLLDRIVLREALLELPAKERELIRLRYFEEKTQAETAKALRTNQVRISRMEKKILLKLRQRMASG